MEGAKIHDERDRNRGLHGAVRTIGGAAYYSRAAPRVLTKENTTGARARAPSRSCRCAKALTETHPGVRDWLSATRICMQSKLGTANSMQFSRAAGRRGGWVTVVLGMGMVELLAQADNPRLTST